MKKDNIFTNKNMHERPFTFDENVTNVFDDMINRSVPFYQEIQALITELVLTYYKEGESIYDLGCSTGTTCINIAKKIHEENPKHHPKIVGLDNSKAMIEKAKLRTKSILKESTISYMEHDLNNKLETENAQIFILNLVLQFLPIPTRKKIIENCFNSLKPNGILIIVEKTLPEQTSLQPLFRTLYHQFKHRQGYSQKEILGKEQSLNTVLKPVKLSEIKTYLSKSGFNIAETFFQWYNFSGVLAIKQ